MSSPQPDRASTAASPNAQLNPSFANILAELGNDIQLLKYLPFSRATFAPQYELSGAAPERLLYGDMMEEKDQIWIYFTLTGGGDNYNKETSSNRMISFYKLKNAQKRDITLNPKRVQELALASQPFKQARDHWQIMVSSS